MAVLPPPLSPLNAPPSPHRLLGGRSRNSFNVERMIVHTVKEVKSWGDPAAAAAVVEPRPPSDDGFAVLDDDSSTGGPTTGTGCLRKKGRGACRVTPRSAQDDWRYKIHTARHMAHGCSKILKRKIC